MTPPILSMTLGFGAGLVTGLVFLIPSSVVLAGLPLAGVALLRGRPASIVGAAFAIGLAVGAGASAARHSACATRWDPGEHSAVLRVHDAPDGRGVAWATVIHAPERCGGELVTRFPADGPPSGATIVATGIGRMGGVFSVRHYRRLARSPGWRYRLRDRVARRIDALYGARAGLVAALVLGRRGDVPRELRSRFVESGLAHLLAISGLHVGLLAGWLGLAVRLLGARRRAWLWASAGVWLYVVFLGFPASATRAACFISLYGVARARQRHPAPSVVLAATIFAILTVAPETVTSVGAWLSCTAVWGTVAATRIFRRLRRRGTRLVAASIGATLATAPITGLVFGAVAPIGILTNLLAIPLAGLAVPGVFASLLVGAPLARGAGLALAAIERVAMVGADVPGGHLAGEPGVAFAAPWVVLAAAALWLAHRRPAWIVLRWRVLVLSATGAWGLALAARWPVSDGEGLVVYVLDVGQGDAIVIRTPRGRWALIDGGPRTASQDAGRRVVVPFLRRHRVRALDLVLVSHGDADHLGGVPAVLRAVPTGRLLEPGQALGTQLYQEHLGVVDEVGAQWAVGRAGDTVLIDGVTLALLHPPTAWAERELRPNENSLVVRLTYGAFDALLTGDIGWPAESLLLADVQPVEVLKVGHHGSAGSTGDRWLSAVRPKAAVISVGRNPYGHPSPSVLSRLRERGVVVFRTDRGGTVTIRSDGSYFEIAQGDPNSIRQRLLCQFHRWSRSRASSSSRSDCIRRPPGSSRTSFTTWRSPPKTSPPS